MKKFFIIIILALLQCACATSQGVSGGSTLLLGFEAISAEIKVGYENLEEQYDPSQAVALNLQD